MVLFQGSLVRPAITARKIHFTVDGQNQAKPGESVSTNLYDYIITL